MATSNSAAPTAAPSAAPTAAPRRPQKIEKCQKSKGIQGTLAKTGYILVWCRTVIIINHLAKITNLNRTSTETSTHTSKQHLFFR